MTRLLRPEKGRNVKYSITQNEYGTWNDKRYAVEATELSATQTQDIIKVLNRALGLDYVAPVAPIAPVVFQDSERQCTDLSTFDAEKLNALYQAAKLFYGVNGNKILAIKHIRTLTGGNLLQSKQLVDYVIGGPTPNWWKL